MLNQEDRLRDQYVPTSSTLRIHKSREGVSAASILARVEALPVSGRYRRLVATVASAHLFDAFDSLAIAFVLPVLVALWALTPSETGVLLSAGYVGQAVGAIFIAWLAERYGRLAMLRFSLLIVVVFAVGCAVAWNYESFLTFRTLQGLGLGAEVPVAATYINEFTRAQYRGRIIMGLQTVFGVGIAVTSAAASWLIPHYGWRSLFVVGVAPMILVVGLRRFVPESPRWLASRGRMAEADAALRRLEEPPYDLSASPASESVQSEPISGEDDAHLAKNIFGGIYLKRTITAWVMCFCTAFISYGLLLWIPTIVRNVYKLPLEQSLQLGVWMSVVGLAGPILCLFFIDRLGRKISFLIAFLGAFVGMGALWYLGDGRTAQEVIICATVSYVFTFILLTGLFLYIPEIYPTRMRAVGTGSASAWLRIASIISPAMVGFTLQHFGIDKIFLIFSAVSLVGAVVVSLFMIETRGRRLEELSP